MGMVAFGGVGVVGRYVVAEVMAVDSVKMSIPFALGSAMAFQKLANDSIGNCTLKLLNCAVGSRYRVERQSDGALVTEGTVSGASGFADVELTVPYYSIGSASNSMIVKVRKASASPYYRPFETLALAGSNGSNVYVSQQLDE